MNSHSTWAATLMVIYTLIVVPPARADYEAGQRALDAGDGSEAIRQWRAAASAEDRRAMLALGRLYMRGLGVLQDYVEAHKWFNLAASRGEVEAVRERDALSANMTPAQVATAQERAGQWQPWALQSTPTAWDAASPAPAAPEASVPVTDPPRRPASREEIHEAQRLLVALGYAPGPDDGKWGPRSMRAYEAFLRDASMPSAQSLNPDAMQAMRDELNRRQEETETTALKPPASASEGTEVVSARSAQVRVVDESRDSTTHTSAAPSMAETIADVANVVIHGIVALELAKMAKDPASFKRVAPELQKLLTKMLSGLSPSEFSNAGVADISLGGLTLAERSRMSELLKNDQGLPKDARVALVNALQTNAGPVAVPKPKCAEVVEDADCLREITNKRGCYLWTGGGYPNATVNWSGGCSGAIADGRGKIVWTNDGESSEWTGTLSAGKRQGHWHVRYADGGTSEGPYENGKRQGNWVIRNKFQTEEGPYVDGKRQGNWVIRDEFQTEEGPYVDGMRQGNWVVREQDGWVWKAPTSTA